MSSSIYSHIRHDPRFAELAARRRLFAGTMTAIVLVAFYGFVLLVAFWPEMIGRRLFEGSNLSFGVAAGMFQFALFWGLTYLYVRRANGEFEVLNQQIVNDALRAQK
ncbi:DUF485 domain-containing protein [Thauera sp. SDU_THAU2]|uniref:DUF485 domain-containing protein n=1 Tax=Thauera sp. SDU_THAU2 TaxID=3136633 RepID=UPI00311EB404